MSPAKSEGFSRHKRNEIVVDDPPVEAQKDKEASYSKSNYSKEEGSRDPSSEWPPLIDPWYDTHSYFLVLPDDNSPPPLGSVWLSLEWHDYDISWAPLASSIPDLTIH